MSDQIDQKVIEKFKTATVTLAYLTTTGCTHSSPLAAIAELTDNSKDAGAKNVRIDFVERDGLETIEVQDDGVGMSPEEVANIIAFGHSKKSSDDTTFIGRFGSGLKSGGLRLGSEFLLVTKKNKIYTAMLISNKFHTHSNISEKVVVPCPSFDENFDPVTDDLELHEAEVKVIEKFAPMGRDHLWDMFAKLECNESGTLIIIDKLRRDQHSRLEINFSKKDDMQLDIFDAASWKTSLRSYLEILYQNSNLKIRLRGKDIEEKFLTRNLMFRRKVTETNLQFRERYAETLENAEKKIENLKHKLGDVLLQIVEDNNNAQLFRGNKKTSHQQNRVLHEKMSKALNEAEKEKAELLKTRGGPKSTVTFVLGINVQERSARGIYFYLNHRLIKVDTKLTKNILGLNAVVNFTYEMFLPTQSKQDFANAKDLKMYLNLCRNWIDIYVTQLKTEYIPRWFGNLNKTTEINSENAMSIFWRLMGYADKPRLCGQSLPSRITRDMMNWIISRNFKQCSLCGIWRGSKEEFGLEITNCAQMKRTCGNAEDDDVLPLDLTIIKYPVHKTPSAPIKSQTIQSVQPVVTPPQGQAVKRAAEKKPGAKRAHNEQDDVITLNSDDEEVLELPKKAKTAPQQNLGSSLSPRVSESPAPTTSDRLGVRTSPSNRNRESKSLSRSDTASQADDPSGSDRVSIPRDDYVSLQSVKANVKTLMDWLAHVPGLGLEFGDPADDTLDRLQHIVTQIDNIKQKNPPKNN